MAGDTLWFRSYIVDATLHKPLQNKYIFVELVNPLDSIVSQVLVRPGENIYQGYLPLSLYPYANRLSPVEKHLIDKQNDSSGNPYQICLSVHIRDTC